MEGRVYANTRTEETSHGGEGVRFVALPEDLRRTCGSCSCGKCPNGRAEWDTLAVFPTRHVKSGRENARPWTVHFPDLVQRGTRKVILTDDEEQRVLAWMKEQRTFPKCGKACRMDPNATCERLPGHVGHHATYRPALGLYHHFE